MENNTRTLYGIGLETALLLGVAPPMLANTTLNELLNINPGQTPAAGTPPTMRYFALDRGGVTVATGADGSILPAGAQHQSTDAGGFSMFPFLMRLAGSDLDPATRAQYALRRIETHGGLQYDTYYLRRMDFADVAVTYKYTTVDPTSGAETTTAYVPTSANLNPVPQQLSSSGTNRPSGDYVTASSVLNVSLSASDCTELLNCAQIIYNDPRYAIITNMLLVSGYDQTMQTPSDTGSSSFAMLEANCAQITHFYNTFQPVTSEKDGIAISLEVGGTEPLMNVSSN
jgi:hypothetical protein